MVDNGPLNSQFSRNSCGHIVVTLGGNENNNKPPPSRLFQLPEKLFSVALENGQQHYRRLYLVAFWPSSSEEL